jgi:hypothetical protein
MANEPGGWACAAMAASLACAFVVYYSLIAWFAHRERMAKIQLGIDPDRRGGEVNLPELADRLLALEREVERLRAPERSPPLGGDKPPVSIEITKSPLFPK